MKVYISNYRHHWISPYTILEYVFFWTAWSKCARRKDIVSNEEWVDYPAWVTVWAERLQPVSCAIQWVLQKVYPRINYVKVDRWDSWSADHTLALVILPVLKELRAQVNGAPCVDDDDVPDELKSTSAPAKENEWDTDDNHFKRWDYVLDEMIFAFQCKVDDSWEEQFHSGQYDDTKIPGEEGWQGTAKWDHEGYKKFHARISNGFRLFGKYYEGLWW